MPILFRIGKKSLSYTLKKIGSNTKPWGCRKRNNRRFCPYTEVYGSVKTRILAYFMQCHFHFWPCVPTEAATAYIVKEIINFERSFGFKVKGRSEKAYGVWRIFCGHWELYWHWCWENKSFYGPYLWNKYTQNWNSFLWDVLAARSTSLKYVVKLHWVFSGQH